MALEFPSFLLNKYINKSIDRSNKQLTQSEKRKEKNKLCDIVDQAKGGCPRPVDLLVLPFKIGPWDCIWEFQKSGHERPRCMNMDSVLRREKTRKRVFLWWSVNILPEVRDFGKPTWPSQTLFILSYICIWMEKKISPGWRYIFSSEMERILAGSMAMGHG